jgi:hypothetical protein
LGSNAGTCFWRKASPASFPKRPCLVRFCAETCAGQFAASARQFMSSRTGYIGRLDGHWKRNLCCAGMSMCTGSW